MKDEALYMQVARVLCRLGECAGVQHHTVTRLIQRHETDFADFGILRFEIEEIKGRGQPAKHYQLNEPQATLLMTYLKNTEQVRWFKKELVRQFYAMRRELEIVLSEHQFAPECERRILNESS